MRKKTFFFSLLLVHSVVFSQNLVINGGAEISPIVGNGWTQVSGDWQQRSANPSPQEGNAYFFAGANAIAELYQDVDVSSDSINIDLGIQTYLFSCYLRSFQQSPVDASKVIVHYKDDSDNVLGTYDTGFSFETNQWVLFTDTRLAPIGTRTIRITLISDRFSGSNNDGYVDNIILQECLATGIDTRTACDSFIWIDGNTYYENNNSATFNIVGGANNLCDSLVTLNLTINHSSSGIDSRTACDSLVWIDGNTYYTNINTATFTIVGGAANFCDSIVTLDLTINEINLPVTQAGTLLTSDEMGANYQWLICPEMTPINGATNQSYNAASNGEYAVIITKNGCSDTSACMSVIGVGVVENNFDNELLLYPNPTNGSFSIDLGATYRTVDISISDITGRLIRSDKFSQEQIINLSIQEPNGVYILTVYSGDKKAIIRLIKN